MKIKHLLILVFNTFIIVTLVTFSVLFYESQKKALLNGIDEKLFTSARFAKSIHGENYHDKIFNKDSISLENFNMSVDTYNKLCLDLDLQYLWSILELDKKLVFTSSTSPKKNIEDGDHAKFMEVHTNPDVYKKALSSMEIQYTSFEDKWGKGRMVLVPAKDKFNRPYCFGASMSINNVQTVIRSTLLNLIIVCVIVSLIGLFLSILLSNYLSKPLAKLTSAAKNIANGNLNHIIEINGTDEIEILSKSFNSMTRAICEKIEEVENKNKILEKEIDEHKKTKKALISERGMLDIVTQNVGVGLAIISKDFRTIWSNNVIKNIFGDVEGEHCHWSYNRKKEVCPDCGVWQIFKKEKEIAVHEQKGKDIKGNTVWSQIIATPIRNGGGSIESALEVVIPITERKLAEKEKAYFQEKLHHTQKLESLGILAGGIAHDFNNILMIILGNADIAITEIQHDIRAKKNINKIQEAGQRLAELTGQMLAYSGQGKFLSEITNINDLIRGLEPLLKSSVSKKSILKINLTKYLPAIDADSAQIRQIIMNLVINASEAIGDKSGEIHIKSETKECNNDFVKKLSPDNHLTTGKYIMLEVRDTGCGMTSKQAGKIFDPFYTSKFQGRGLGLSAVHGIIQSHKGMISVSSIEGSGSTFRVYLPILGVSLNKKVNSFLDIDNDWTGEGTILLVDDEDDILSLGKEMLEKKGFNVLTAGNGNEAVKLFSKYHNNISCVILDLTMPIMDGAEAFTKMEMIQNDLKVIISSGYTEIDVKKTLKGRNISGVLHKPFEYRDLLKKVREVLM